MTDEFRKWKDKTYSFFFETGIIDFQKKYGKVVHAYIKIWRHFLLKSYIRRLCKTIDFKEETKEFKFEKLKTGLNKKTVN